MSELVSSETLRGLRGVLVTDQTLARHTTWRVGGPAQRLYRAADLDDLCVFFAQMPESEPLFFLGLGSNLLIRDGGIPGTVIATHGALSGMSVQEDGTVRVEAGVPCARVARFCARQGLVGGEFLVGIPGTIGGALTMNAGAWGCETWDWVTLVETVDRHGRLRLRETTDYSIGYRSCRLQSGTSEWFVAAHLWLPNGDGEQGEKRIRQLIEQRSRHQPIGAASCGSVFQNPADDYAARMIEASGLKGFAIGGACVSNKHANFIINDGNASAADIETLIHWVGDAIEQDHGVRLRTEVRMVGLPTVEEGSG